jgi:hypothetical protein
MIALQSDVTNDDLAWMHKYGIRRRAVRQLSTLTRVIERLPFLAPERIVGYAKFGKRLFDSLNHRDIELTI